jgi:OmcA/MtrC family decaheme c-type cytochrome
MIHSIHAGKIRTNPYKHTRSKTGSNTIYDWSAAVYPNKLNNCETCHIAGTYGDVPAGALASVNTTPTNGTSVFDARTKLPNLTDTVISPYSAACVSCHDSDASKAHMETNGGKVSKARSALVAGSEACATCHGVGKVYGVDVVHE